jgi:hypothetical protein
MLTQSRIIWKPHTVRYHRSIQFQTFQTSANNAPQEIMNKGMLKSLVIPNKMKRRTTIKNKRRIFPLWCGKTLWPEKDRRNRYATVPHVTGRKKANKKDEVRFSKDRKITRMLSRGESTLR